MAYLSLPLTLLAAFSALGSAIAVSGGSYGIGPFAAYLASILGVAFALVVVQLAVTRYFGTAFSTHYHQDEFVAGIGESLSTTAPHRPVRCVPGG